MADERASDPQFDRTQVASVQLAGEQASAEAQEQRPATGQIIGESLEVDSFGDHDSSLGDDQSVVSSTTSINSTQFHYAHGKRYHGYKDVHYVLPNNEQEMDRLELQHRIWDIMLGGRLNLAPLTDNISHAIDLGCGTGAWAIEFADAYPNCDVIGLDLSPIQPTSIPPNLSFIVDDATAEWTFSAPFDYIHTRAISSGIKDWPSFLEQCFKHLKPGGWLELQEFHMPFECDDGSAESSAVLKWTSAIGEAVIKTGIDISPNSTNQRRQRLTDAGFESVNEAHSKWPIGPWARGENEKRIGTLFLKDVHGNVENLSSRIFLGLLGYSEEDYAAMVEEVREDLMNRKIHMYMPVNIFWARKPFN